MSGRHATPHRARSGTSTVTASSGMLSFAMATESVRVAWRTRGRLQCCGQWAVPVMSRLARLSATRGCHHSLGTGVCEQCHERRAEEIDLPGPGATARIRQAMVGDWHRREGSVRSPGLSGVIW